MLVHHRDGSGRRGAGADNSPRTSKRCAQHITVSATTNSITPAPCQLGPNAGRGGQGSTRPRQTSAAIPAKKSAGAESGGFVAKLAKPRKSLTSGFLDTNMRDHLASMRPDDDDIRRLDPDWDDVPAESPSSRTSVVLVWADGRPPTREVLVIVPSCGRTRAGSRRACRRGLASTKTPVSFGPRQRSAQTR